MCAGQDIWGSVLCVEFCWSPGLSPLTADELRGLEVLKAAWMKLPRPSLNDVPGQARGMDKFCSAGCPTKNTSECSLMKIRNRSNFGYLRFDQNLETSEAQAASVTHPKKWYVRLDEFERSHMHQTFPYSYSCMPVPVMDRL